MTREEFLAAAGRLYDEAHRVAEGRDNRPTAIAHAEIAGAASALLRASGISDSFDCAFELEFAEEQDPAAGLYHAIAATLIRYGGGFMPERAAATLGADAQRISERIWPPRVAALLRDIPKTLERDGGAISIIGMTICAARYAAAACKHRRSWVRFHTDILPADADGYPSDDLRSKRWLVERVQPEMLALFDPAGAARADSGPDDPIPAELADAEVKALEWLARDPMENRRVFDQIMAAQPTEQREKKPAKTAAKSACARRAR